MKKIGILFILLITTIFLVWIFMPLSKDTKPMAENESTKNDVIHLKFGHNTPVDSALHEAAMKFAQEVKQKTDSHVIIDIYPAQQLGNDHQMVEMARDGELDIILTPTAKMSVAVPSMQYADLPFYFPTRQDVYDMLDGEPGQMILNHLKPIGLIGVAFWENGFKHFTANSPILSVEDFKNKRIRVMKSRIIMEQFRSFGAEPLPIDFHSTKKALHDKVVDGQENPLIAIVSMGFHEEQSDLTLSEHAYLGYVLSFSEKSFNKLPQNIQMILVESAKDVTPWEREETQRREAKLLDIIEQSGVHIHQISDKERQRFAEKTAHIAEEFENIIGSDIISKTKELLYKKYGAHLNNEDHILIGIDTDLSADSKVAGLAIKRGAEIAVEEINKKGGLLGKHLEVIVKDHRAIASKGVQNVQEFAKNKHLAAIIGGVHGPIISAEIETVQKLKIPYLIPWAATAGLVKNSYKDNYIFRVSANDNIVANFLAKYTLKKYNKPAIIVVNSVWGRSNLKIMKQYFQKRNIMVAAEVIFNRGQNSFEKEVTELIKSGADSVIMVANPIEASKILEGIKNRKKSLPIISHWGVTSGDFFKKNEETIKELDLSVFQTFSFDNTLNEKGKHLLERYRTKYSMEQSKEIKASTGVAQTYDVVYLLALAIEKAGSLDKTKIKKALENLPNYQGVVKNYTPAFSTDNHDALDGRDYYMAKYNKDGHLVPITDK